MMPHDTYSNGRSTRRACVVLALGLLALTPALASAATGYDVNAETLQRFMGRSHAILVHFPIAMVIVAATLEVMVALRSRLRPAEPPVVSQAGLTCLSFGALGAIAASVAGWLNAANEGVGSADQSTLFWHRWLGITVAALSVLTVIAGMIARSTGVRSPIGVYRAAVVVAALVVGFTGHLGGNMVYGDGYLLAAFEVEKAAPAPLPGNSDAGAPVLASDAKVVPAALTVDAALASAASAIFERSCVECHGRRRQKGDLRVDSLASLAENQVVVPGDPDASELIRRVTLPPDDDDFMPQDDTPLAKEEIDTIRAWIAAVGGKPFTPSVAVQASPSPEAPAAHEEHVHPEQPASEKTVAAQAHVPVVEVKIELTDAQRAARQRAIDAIRGAGAFAATISASSDLVQANFAMLGKACTDQSLELLAGLEPVLVEVNLSGTAVTDSGIKTLQRFTLLERINLGRTALTDAGVENLSCLPRLASLNLHNTAVTDHAGDVMSGMHSLRRAYVWRTSMTPDGISRLASGRTDLAIDTGAAPPAPPPAVQAAEATPAAPPAPAPEAVTKSEPATTVAAAKPGCCKKAEDEGRLCDHPCCVEARAKGQVCQKCLGN